MIKLAQTPDDSAVALGKLIRKKRKERGWTLKDVAYAVGVSESTVSRWENGLIKNMRGSHFALLSQELNIPLSAFLIEDPNAVEAGKELITNSQLARQNRQKERQSLKQLCYDLHEQGNSYMSIAQKLGIAWTTARRYDQQIKADKLAKEDQPIKKVDKTNHRRPYKSKQKLSAISSKTTKDKDIALGKIIHEKRKEQGKTLEDVAQAVGVSETSVFKWEHGQNKDLFGSHIAGLSRELNIPVSAFFDKNFENKSFDTKKSEKEEFTISQFTQQEYQEDSSLEKVEEITNRKTAQPNEKPSAAASELDKVNSEPIQTDGKTIAIHQLINREHKEPVEEFDLNEIKKAGSVKARRARGPKARKARQAKERKEKQKQDELRNAILLSAVQSTFSKK